MLAYLGHDIVLALINNHNFPYSTETIFDSDSEYYSEYRQKF